MKTPISFESKIDSLLISKKFSFTKYTSILEKLDAVQVFYQDKRAELLSFITDALEEEPALTLQQILASLDLKVNAHFGLGVSFKVSKGELFG